MAAFDYAEIAADAQELIEEFGRLVTFRTKSRTPADTAKPWRGPNYTEADVDIADIKACIVPDDHDDEARTLVRKPTALLYVADKSFPTGTDVKNMDSVLDDDGTLWHITKTQIIKPATVAVLYVMFLEG